MMDSSKNGMRLIAIAALLLLFILALEALAHGAANDDKVFIEDSAGAQLVPYAYLGAKHMVTGYDHLLFLTGVIFFLYKPREVVGGKPGLTAPNLRRVEKIEHRHVQAEARCLTRDEA